MAVRSILEQASPMGERGCCGVGGACGSSTCFGIPSITQDSTCSIFFKVDSKNHQGHFGVIQIPVPYYLAKSDTHAHFRFQVVFGMSCNTLESTNIPRCYQTSQRCSNMPNKNFGNISLISIRKGGGACPHPNLYRKKSYAMSWPTLW